MIKLNLGCGKKYLPGFINIDIEEFDHVDYVTSIDKLDIFRGGSVNLIYASHVLEHTPRPQTEPILNEWYRVLIPGGILRVAVPDFEAIVKVYSKNRNLEELLGLLYGKQDCEHDFHYKVFDFNTLLSLLKMVGFKKVYKYDFQKTIHKDYPDYSWAHLPHGDRENGMLMSLNIEAVK